MNSLLVILSFLGGAAAAVDVFCGNTKMALPGTCAETESVCVSGPNVKYCLSSGGDFGAATPASYRGSHFLNIDKLGFVGLRPRRLGYGQPRVRRRLFSSWL
jgi:hypothetical protein